MARLYIAVLRGGPSAEHDISLKTSQAMLDNLDKNKYQTLDVVISRDGKWAIDNKDYDTEEAIKILKNKQVDVVLLGLHGTFGEDGTVQAMLSKAGLAYTGSNSRASRDAMDKIASNALYKRADLLVPMTVVFDSNNLQKGRHLIDLHMKYPFIIKPVSQGSSVGVHLVNNESELQAALEEAAQHDSRLMAQEYVAGREVSCGVLENYNGQKTLALPPTELIPVSSAFFDFDAKYTPGATKEVTPPEMSEQQIKEIEDKATTAHAALNCRGYSRTDMILDEKNQLFMIETNTLPGMTETSILPQQAKAAGISFSELLDNIIENAGV